MDDVFSATRDRFLAALAEEDRLLFSPCATREQLLLGLEQLKATAQKFKRRSDALGLLDQIDSFSRRLQPFCTIIDTLVSSNPEVSALVWGGLKLVLHLASNYGDFLDRTVKVLGQFTETFPQYADVARFAAQADHGRLREAVSAIYLNLFDLFHILSMVFVKNDGGPKATINVVASMIWRPFDSRLSDLLERLAFQQQIVRDELNLAQARAINHLVEAQKQENKLQERRAEAEKRARVLLDEIKSLSQDMVRSMEQRHEEETVSRIQAWLSPSSFAEAFEESLGFAKEDTGHWFLEDPSFMRWLRPPEPTSAPATQTTGTGFGTETLWVHGRPGCGKTVLAATIIKDMKVSQQASTGSRPPETVFYFFQFDSPHNNTTAALRAIMSQLLQLNRSNRALLDACLFVMKYSSHGQTTATANELSDLIVSHMQNSVAATTIVLDGIDEADDVPNTVRTLRSLAAARACRMLLLSRPAVVALQRAIPTEMRLEVNKVGVANDIGLYIRQELDELVSTGLLHADVDSALLTGQLTTAADGMFLWARLMMTYISSPIFDASRRLQIIRDDKLPQGLEAMYDRICSTILGRNSEERKLASQVLVWLTYSLTHLDTAQMREVLRQSPDDSTNLSSDPEADRSFEEGVLWACAGLVDRAHESHTPPQDTGQGLPRGNGFRFTHLSAKEYFLTDPASEPWSHLCGSCSSANAPRRGLVPSLVLAHIDLAMKCLRYLLYHSPEQPISGNVSRGVDPHTFRQGFPFALYAAPFWIRHLGAFLSAQRPAGARLEFHSGRCHELDLGAYVGPIAGLLKSFLAKPLTIMSWIEAHYLSTNLAASSEATYPSAGVVLELCPESDAIYGLAQLMCGDGCSSQNTLYSAALGNPRHDGSSLSGLKADLLEFEKDMRELQAIWGTNLHHTPGIIWDEIPAFMSSKFLINTGTTQATSLAPVTLNLPNTSTCPLCVVSDVDSRGKLMAVLSVWPSRKFQTHWGRLTANSNCEDLEPACHGWVARYQLWDVEERHSQVADIRITCSAGEVWLLVRQSLRFETDSGWKLSFPLAIGRTCLQFIVLRTVFLLEPANESNTEATPGIQSFTLPMDETPDLCHIWSLARNILQPFPCSHDYLPQMLAKCQNSWYAYTLTFSPGSRFIALADFEFNMSTHLVVWEIVPGETLQYRLIECARHETMQGGHIQHLEFHSDDALIVFCDLTRLYRWNFLHSHPHWVCLIPHVIKRLSVSADSSFAIIDDSVIPLYPDDDMWPLQIPRRKRISEQLLAQTTQQLGILALEPHAPSPPLFQPGQVLRGTMSTNVASGSINLHVGSSVALETSTLAATHLLNLLALPQWPGLEHTFAIVRLPSHAGCTVDSTLKILLNKSSSSSYHLSSSVAEGPAPLSFPMVVDRYVGSVTTRSATPTISIAASASRAVTTMTATARTTATTTTTATTATTDNTAQAPRNRRLQIVENMGLIARPGTPGPKAW